MPRARLLTVSLALIALVFTACDVTPPQATGTPGDQPTPTDGGPTATPAGPVGARLSAVQSRGRLICGVNGGLTGFSELDEATNEMSGFDADYCRAVAAAVLGDPTAVDFRTLSTGERGPALQTGDIDVLIRNTTWTVGRDTSWGLFAPTTFYDGQGMMVNRTRTQAQNLAELDGATVCVQSGTTTEQNLADAMQGAAASYTPQVFQEIDPTYAAYSEGRCDAVTSDISQLVARKLGFANPTDHVILDVVMSKEPLGPVAPLGDDQWFNVIKWTVFATFQAEESGITQANVAQLRDTSEDPVIRRLLGVQPDAGTLASDLGLADDWVVSVISAVGNYGEIYNRHLGPDTPINIPRGVNRPWTEGGLLYAAPYR